jgi:tetratricopeptide (TPR) repeat protein
MASANDPSASAAPPTSSIVSAEDKERIPLPPPLKPKRRGLTPEVLLWYIQRLDWALVATALVLAFLLASFVARNSDVWQHLAAGRLIAHGEFTFGKDPFTYTCADSRWVNTAWLSDLLGYGLFTLAGGLDPGHGGTALLVAKALLITLVAGVLLAIRRPGQSLWAPAACTGLAVLVMSPRLLLQPILVSLLFLGLTIYLLQRSPEGAETRAGRWFRWTGGRAWILLPPLFALWVNLDQWFLLGPVTVFLYLVGGLLHQYFRQPATALDDPQPAELPRLAAVLAVGVAACLLSPNHIHVFTTLPPELAAVNLGEEVRHDQFFRAYFQSPFGELGTLIRDGSSDYFDPRDHGNVAGISYFVLLLLGLGSFALNLEGWSWWRLLVWLAFAVLSALQARAVPLFAVVAGPITALNLQDYAARRFGTLVRVEGNWPLWSLAGRGLTLVLGIVLVLGTWPGWLHAAFGDGGAEHRVAWDVEADPSLRAAVERVRELRQAGALKEGEHGFNLVPHIANYCAWFAPEEKGFFDFRFQLSPAMARTYAELRRALPGDPSPMSGAAVGESPIRWADVFDKYAIKYVVLNRRDPAAGPRSIRLCTEFRAEWTPLYADGQTTVIAWRDPALEAYRFDPPRLAFGHDAYRAPDSGPSRPPHVNDWWDNYTHPVPGRSVDASRARLYMDLYDVESAYWQRAKQIAFARAVWLISVLEAVPYGQLPSVGVSGGGPVGIFAAVSARLPAQRPLPGLLFRALLPPEIARHFQDAGPPAYPLLAIRAARRAIAANPDDGDAYWQLARAYEALWLKLEASWLGGPPEGVRHAQLAAALLNAVTLEPTNYEAHLMLATEVYGPRHFIDLTQYHLREGARHLEEKLPLMPEQMRAVWQQRLDGIKKDIEYSEKRIEARRNDWLVASRNRPPVEKVGLALQDPGLAGEALRIMEQVDPSELSNRDLVALGVLQMKLFLLTGHLEKAKQMDSPERTDRLLIAAADGDYAKAGEYLDEMIKLQRDHSVTDMMRAMRQLMLAAGHEPGPYNSEGLSLQNLAGFVAHAVSFRAGPDLMLLRGMLAIEQGDVATAERSFERALDQVGAGPRVAHRASTALGVGSLLELNTLAAAALYDPARPWYPPPPSPLALRYLELIRDQK